MEGSSESTSPGKQIVEGSSVSEQSVGDAGRGISSETQKGKKGRSATPARSSNDPQRDDWDEHRELTYQYRVLQTYKMTTNFIF